MYLLAYQPTPDTTGMCIDRYLPGLAPINQDGEWGRMLQPTLTIFIHPTFILRKAHNQCRILQASRQTIASSPVHGWPFIRFSQIYLLSCLLDTHYCKPPTTYGLLARWLPSTGPRSNIRLSLLLRASIEHCHLPSATTSIGLSNLCYLSSSGDSSPAYVDLYAFRRAVQRHSCPSSSN